MKNISKSQLISTLLIIFINCIIVFIFPFECPWKKVLGIDCGGCGTTRMIKSMLNLNFYQAFRYNPLTFILLILGLIYIVYCLVCLLLKKKYYKVNEKTLFILGIIVIIFMILRNIDQFSFLRPTVIN